MASLREAGGRQLEELGRECKLMDDCAGECEVLGDGGMFPDGGVKALPGPPDGSIPPLALTEMRVAESDEGLARIPEDGVKAAWVIRWIRATSDSSKWP
eukprot:6280044-Amphidinium_carterae.1